MVSLHVEPGYWPFESRKYFNWKASCQPSTATYCIAGISYNSIHKYSSTKHNHLLSDNPRLDKKSKYSDTKHYVHRIFRRHVFILRQIQNHEMLQHAVITDIKTHRSLVPNKEQLVELRNTSFASIYNRGMNCYNKYFVSLHLPASDLLLEGVSCIVVKLGKNAANDGDIIRAMDFQDDEMIFREALVSIFRELGLHSGK